jgi:ribosomal protein S25
LREKKNNRVVFTQQLLDQVCAGAPKRKALTVYSLIETYKIGGACARKVIKKLVSEGAIKVVSKAGDMSVYTSAKDE